MHDDEHALGAHRAGEEGEERAGGAVGPVDVLEPEDGGRRGRAAPAASAAPRTGGAGRRPRPPRSVGGDAVRLQLGQQRRELGRALADAPRAPGRRRGRAGAARRPAARRAARPRRARCTRRRAARRRVLARADSSFSRRDLPTPDSPATKAIEGCPSGPSAKAASSSASSPARPISRVLVTRVATTAQYRRWTGRIRCGHPPKSCGASCGGIRPRCRNACGVAQRPRGVRRRNPRWSR